MKNDEIEKRLLSIDKKLNIIIKKIDNLKSEEDDIENEEEVVEKEEKKIEKFIKKSDKSSKRMNLIQDWEKDIRFGCNNKSLGDEGELFCEVLKSGCLYDPCPIRK